MTKVSGRSRVSGPQGLSHEQLLRQASEEDGALVELGQQIGAEAITRVLEALEGGAYLPTAEAFWHRLQANQTRRDAIAWCRAHNCEVSSGQLMRRYGLPRSSALRYLRQARKEAAADTPPRSTGRGAPRRRKSGA